MVPTDPDEQLVDADLAAEIALLGEVIAAAASAGRTLSDEEVDDALGLGRASPPPEPLAGGEPYSRPLT